MLLHIVVLNICNLHLFLRVQMYPIGIVLLFMFCVYLYLMEGNTCGHKRTIQTIAPECDE
jgi:MFS-type transporter involved in bile tolerance (Atg22 family)